MGASRWVASTFAAVGAIAMVAVGLTGALAQEDGPATGGDSDEDLLARLDTLETDLPGDPPPEDVDLDATTTWGTLDGDAGSVSAVLATLEPDLRALFVDADDADGEVAEAVATVTRGWLDVWQGTSALAVWEGHDLAFPIDTFDDDDVATGADERRGDAEIGLELILTGRQRHLEGYTALRTLGAADAPTQQRFDERAAAAETFENELRPEVVALLSQETTAVVMATDRFQTNAPGVEPRATSMNVVCIDRDILEELGGVVTDEVLARVEDASERADCPGRPDELQLDPAEVS